MPFVSSYFRRSPGAAGQQTSRARRLDVAFYGSDGMSLLNDRYGARYRLENLQFSTGLPGGFLAAAFTLISPVANNWVGRPGDVVIIRRGNAIVWWGWLEDFRRTVRGMTESLFITALGPWQVLQQRLCSPSYAATIYSNEVLVDTLEVECPEISPDFSQIAATSVDVAPLTWTNTTVADVAKLACDVGNAAGLQMLFAVWQPVGIYRYPTALNANPDFQTDDGTGNMYAWRFYSVGASAPNTAWTQEIYNSPTKAVKIWHTANVRSETADVINTDLSATIVFAVTAGSSYVIDVWVKFGAIAGLQIQAFIRWYSDVAWISEVSLSAHTSTGTTFSARYVESTTAPVGATNAYIFIRVTLANTGAESYVVLDDVYVYDLYAPAAADLKPRAKLWARDTSDYEYVLRTSELNAGLVIDETTRDLVNNVAASYGSASVTAFAADAVSQAAYRIRETVISAGSVSATAAAAQRDAYLAAHLAPKAEPASFALAGRTRALCTVLGAMVWPEDVRAGDRIYLADGPNAGSVFVVKTTSYNNGVVSITPETPDDTAMMLARI